ncbi:voltage-dependent anion-selective channel-like isoform X2 [Sitophilus oryzae]|uniref:Voltage-dependent anion-selective channel-like isoform X2 n=2 Tax=Sitophilus oryzae TaxID=7048 RepID=A0A6J2YZ00_SITOR|nr:voltage-dependent anion-selective channel-like isoform X2 [Sitophilus oryzae]
MDNPCKPPIEEKHYNCPRIVETNLKSDSKRGEVRQVECGKGFGLFGGKKNDEPPPPPPPVPEEDMSPPPYSDLGKKAKDVFNKGYHFGLIKLDCKTKSSSGVEFSTGGTSNQESGKVFGSLETKYNVKEYGLTFTEKWNTDNTLSTDFTVKDQGLEGLKLGACLDFAPHTGQKTGNVKAAFQNPQVAINADAEYTPEGPKVLGSVVLGYQGWLAGAQAGYDINNNKLTKNNFALGFSSGDFTLHTNVDDGQEFGGSIYQKINPSLETGISLNWSSGSSNTKFGIGAKYDLDKDAAVRFKVNNASQIGLGYQQRLREGVTLTLSTLIDGKNFNQGGHKIGLALELEA